MAAPLTLEDHLCGHGRGRPVSPLLPGSELVSLMERHRVSVAALAARLKLTREQVVLACEDGVGCYSCACRWYAAITGSKVFKKRLLDWLNSESDV